MCHHGQPDPGGGHQAEDHSGPEGPVLLPLQCGLYGQDHKVDRSGPCWRHPCQPADGHPGGQERH